MNKTCLNCKFEPEWGDWYGGEDHPRRTGKCRWDGKLPLMPTTHSINIRPISRHSDDSGVVTRCRTWAAKPHTSNKGVEK